MCLNAPSACDPCSPRAQTVLATAVSAPLAPQATSARLTWTIPATLTWLPFQALARGRAPASATSASPTRHHQSQPVVRPYDLRICGSMLSPAHTSVAADHPVPVALPTLRSEATVTSTPRCFLAALASMISAAVLLMNRLHRTLLSVLCSVDVLVASTNVCTRRPAHVVLPVVVPMQSGLQCSEQMTYLVAVACRLPSRRPRRPSLQR